MLRGFIRDILGPCFICLPIFAIICFLSFVFGFSSDRKEIEDSLHIGIITDKEIVNSHNGLFVNYDRRYQIVVEFEYEYHGEKYDCERSVDVDYDIYISYDIGDEFDTYNPVVKELE